jgi:hypothetical protein
MPQLFTGNRLDLVAGAISCFEREPCRDQVDTGQYRAYDYMAAGDANYRECYSRDR